MPVPGASEVTCRECGSTNPATGKFCAECGTPMVAACSACGSPIGPAQKFCGECGMRLGGPADAGPEDRPVHAAARDNGLASVAERRVCSVLFADLVGFTPLSESRDPEDVRELLSRYFDLARTVIGRYGGVVEKFIGDAVMAIWGTPVAGEDDAERAVRAGLELVTAIAALGDEAEIPDLVARVGVVTGEVAVTLGAVGQGLAAGDAVNTAARVQAAAAPGQVWVDETTHRLAVAAIAFTDCGDHRLKGKSRPVRLWAATRVLAGVRGEQRVDGLEAPLVGRDAELRLIKELFHAALDRRTPRLVLVSGPAGVGKSRLGWEFEKYVDGLAQVMWWHRGRCLSYGDGVVFWALAQIVRQRLGIAEEDAVEVTATKLDACTDTYLPDLDERTYVRIRLARLLGVPVAADPGGAMARAELFAGWRLFFQRLAEVQPVVMLIEDLQYADAGLLEFLDHLIDWARDVPIFVLAFTRPELEHTHPGWATGRNRTALTLDPLDRRSMEEMVDALVPDMPGQARGMIIGQAQGIPLFAVETIRSLIDRDIVIPRDGVYHLVADIDTLTVPDGLHALLAARLDALDPDLRALVADAAVLGTSFPADALVAVSGLPEPVVRTGLAELHRREVLEVSADKLSPERGSYRFAQNLLGRVAYLTLSRRDRKARHLAVAAHLRAAFPGDGDEVIDAIARHYRDALEAMPEDPDVELIRSEAVAALVRGAQRALRAGAPRSAATNYATAALLTDGHSPDVMESLAAEAKPDPAVAGQGQPAISAAAAALWEDAARSDNIAGDDAAVLHARLAVTGYDGAGRIRDAARARGLVGRALALKGVFAEQTPWLKAAADVLRTYPDADTVAILNQLAVNANAMSSSEADALSSEALQLGEALEVEDALLSRLFNTRGVFLATQDRVGESIAAYEYAAQLAELAGAAYEACVALTNLSDVNLNRDPRRAAEQARAAREHGRRIGARNGVSVSVYNLATALTLTGEWDTAEEALTEAIDHDGIDDIDLVALSRGILAALRGDIQSAQRLAELPGLRVSEDPERRALIGVLDALIAHAMGDEVGALAHAQRALALVASTGLTSESIVRSWPIAIRAARAVGDDTTVDRLLALLDDRPPGHLPALLRIERDLARARRAAGAGDLTAEPSFESAAAAFRRFGSPHHLANALLDHADYRLAVGDPARALDLVVEAANIAETLGARPVVGRAEKLGRLLDTSLRIAENGPRERRPDDTLAGRSATASSP